MSEELSRVEDLLENGVEEPVLPMSELEAILRGEKIKPHSRVAELLLQYNPQDILIEKSITENGTYYASVDNADGYFKVIVDTPVVPPTVLDHLVETITENGEYTYTPEHDGYSDAEITVNVPSVQPVVASKTITANGTYVAADEQLDGYSQAVVNVPATPLDTMNITHNGTYHPPAGRGFDEVNVTVPLGSKSITANGTYTATDDNLDGYSSVAVDVPQIGIKDIPNTPTQIATFSDGTSNPLKSLTASIEPLQDLHGYDSPWAGGAGKNKIPITCDTQTKQGVTYTVYKNEDGAVIKIHAQGTATADHSFSVVDGYSASNPFIVKAGSYWFKGISNGVSGQFDFNLRKQGESSDLVQITDKKSLELSEDTYFQSCYLYVYSGATVNTDIYPMIWLKSSPNDDFEPYSNICPISGWSGCKVGNLGSKNWYDTRQSLLAGYLNGDGTAGGTGQSINKHTEKIPIKGGITYTYSVAVSRNADQVCLWYDKNNNVIDGFVLLKNTTSITAQAPINAVSASLTVYNVDGQTIQLEAGSQATAYEPYNPNSTTYTIPFLDSQGNPVEVFGGSVDVVNGTLTLSKILYIYDGSQDEQWSKYNSSSAGAYAMTITIPNAIKIPLGIQTIQCNELEPIINTATWGDYDNFVSMSAGSNTNIICGIRTITTVEDWKTYLTSNPLQVMGILETPIIIPIQPTSIKSLDGENNVFASTGEILSGQYFGYVYPELGTKTITENGTYTATDDNLDGYSEVTINVAGGGGETKYYEYIRALDGQVIVRVEYPDAERTYATKTLWFFNGYYTDGGDKPIPDNLWPYLPWGYSSTVLLTSGYSDSTSESQLGWVGFVYPNYRDRSYTKFRTWNMNKGQTMAGTFWGVLDINGGEEQITEWFDPYENVPPRQIKNYGGTIEDGYNLNTELKTLGNVYHDSAMSYEIDNDSFDITWNESGAYIGFSFNGDVDLKASDIQRLSYKIDFGTCYDAAWNQNIRPFIIGVTDTIRTTPSTGIYFDPSNVDQYFTKYKMYYKDVCNTTVEDYVDISDIEGPCYLFIVATGWIASITDLSMVSNCTPQIGTTLSQFNFFNYVSEVSNANKIIPIDTESFDVYWSGAIYIGHCLTGNIPLSGKKRLDIDMDYIGENYQHSSGTHTRNHNLAIVVTDIKVDSYVNLDNLERDNHIIAIKEWDGNDIYGQSIHTSIDLSNISGEYYINYQLPGFNIDGFRARLYSNS